MDREDGSELADFHSELITEHERNNAITDNAGYLEAFMTSKPSNEEYFFPSQMIKKTQALEQVFEDFKQILKDKNVGAS